MNKLHSACLLHKKTTKTPSLLLNSRLDGWTGWNGVDGCNGMDEWIGIDGWVDGIECMGG